MSEAVARFRQRGPPGGPRPAGRRLPGLRPRRARARRGRSSPTGGLGRIGFRGPPQPDGDAASLRRPPCRAGGRGDAARSLARFRNVDPREAVLMPATRWDGRRAAAAVHACPLVTRPIPTASCSRVTTEAPGLLVVADTWMPGWTASVDGRPAPVLRGNHAQRVVPLPAGPAHEIVLPLRHPGLKLGAEPSRLASASPGWSRAALAASGAVVRSRPGESGGPSPGDALVTPPILRPSRAACGATIRASGGW